MKSPVMKLVGNVVWLITALASIHIGLMALGYNVLDMAHISQFSRTIDYVIGVAGVISLLMMIMWLGSGCSSCECEHSHR